MSNKIENIVSRIIDKMKDGILPWKRDWSQPPISNARTRRPYSGVNVLILSELSDRLRCPYWDTMAGINQQGGNVIKGQHGTLIIVLKKWIPKSKDTEDNNEQVKTYFGCHLVFNMAQTSLAKKFVKDSSKKSITFPEVEKVIADYQKRFNGFPIIEYGRVESPYYNPITDSIKIPFPEDYSNTIRFESTRMHELIHSTGHKSRIDRILSSKIEQYSEEELVAEIGSNIALGLCGIDTSDLVENSASYAYSWYKVLNKNHSILTRACSNASKAAYFILGDNAARTSPREGEEMEDE